MNKLIFLASASLLLVAPTASLLAANAYDTQPSKVVVQDTAKTDGDVARNVKDALATDRTVAPFVGDVTVKSDNGVVTLSGTVSTSKAKSDIETKAKSVSGVTKVVNNIVVK